MKPRVAISQRVDVWAERGERRDALDQRLARWVALAGAVPVPVPNHPEALPDWLAALSPDAVILSGGNDIGAIPERDAAEARLLAYARDGRMPLLGLCRGMQMMAHWAGTALVPVSGHVGGRHRLAAGGWPVEVNSFHNFALADCPPGYEVAARSGDGAIEAIRHRTLPWEGWMWHPERDDPVDPLDTARLVALLNRRGAR
ncbi:gamma-glutamyl-gamma-aminobutyrate hydrolase family protein [Magnetospirillum sp. SS-4]|uniref:gamma-glutamyl-gamma-aminobutyrate hydrolase family protein n=1 Tax=Magnetospirillum sp. SS-4 TaxID=2681465 RepID=UPI001385761B|nr:gamma-glutamyl-gamma-aminobutyrate hydrolase family protein [Magnetospirillum sp. SS-4]CAA7623880.1 putative glutamine amidotransferase [Magnetospirillum sp. SS-4]